MSGNTVAPVRRSDVVASDFEGELLVYDLRRHRAHCLNAGAALVWQHCDGKRRPAELARIWEQTTGLSDGAAVVDLALRQLRRAHLLESAPEDDAPSGITRQVLLRRAAMFGGVALVPLITTLVAPTAAYAMSCGTQGQACCPSGHTCLHNNECCTGTCSGGICA